MSLWKNEFHSRGQFHQFSTSSFYAPRPQKRKKSCLNLTVFFALLGSAHVKDARKPLVKLTPCGRMNSIPDVSRSVLEEYQ